jgi:hypothetical protein
VAAGSPVALPAGMSDTAAEADGASPEGLLANGPPCAHSRTRAAIPINAASLSPSR